MLEETAANHLEIRMILMLTGSRGKTPQWNSGAGCKPHQTGMINSHEILVMPNNTLKEGEKDWAVSFAIPVDTPGMIYVYGRQSCDTRKMEPDH